MSYIKVKGYDGLVRDKTTGAILNQDHSAIEARRKQRHLNNALEDINNLKEEIFEIKALLKELVKNASN